MFTTKVYFMQICAVVVWVQEGTCKIWYYNSQRKPVRLLVVNHERCVRLVLHYSTCWVSPSV